MRSCLHSLAALLALSAVGCAGTETGNPTEPSELKAIALSRDPDAVSIGEGPAPLQVDSYFQVMGTLGYQLCPTNSETIVDILRVPNPVDFVEGTGSLKVTDLPAQDYCGIWLEGLVATQGLDVPDELIDQRLLITGTRQDGARFQVQSDADLRIKLRTAEPLPRGPEGLSIVLALDLAGPLATLPIAEATPDPDGVVRIVQRTDDGSLSPEFADALLASGALFDDANANNAIDPGEAELELVPLPATP